MTKTSSLFVYGALLDPQIRQVVLGAEQQSSRAVLHGYSARTIVGRLFPHMQKVGDGQTSGLVLHGLSTAQMAAADFYLDASLVGRTDISLQLDGRPVVVQTHLPIGAAPALGDPWDFATWTQGAAALQVATHIMRAFRVAGPHNTPFHHHGVDMRAYSNLRAAQGSAPVHLRRGFGASDVEAISRTQPYAGYFAVEDMSVRHRQFDGGQSGTLERAVFWAADAVTVLPYDPVTDQVLMVEQFRTGAYARNDTHPWVLEPVAGRCDANEPIEAVAKREMMEEAGLALLGLEKIGSYYSSPGCMTEYLYSFVGIVDLADAAQATHGLAGEGEDILTHILPYDVAINALQTGEVDNGPLFVSLLWLQINRDRLRKAWASA